MVKRSTQTCHDQPSEEWHQRNTELVVPTLRSEPPARSALPWQPQRGTCQWAISFKRPLPYSEWLSKVEPIQICQYNQLKPWLKRTEKFKTHQTRYNKKRALKKNNRHGRNWQEGCVSTAGINEPSNYRATDPFAMIGIDRRWRTDRVDLEGVALAQDGRRGLSGQSLASVCKYLFICLSVCFSLSLSLRVSFPYIFTVVGVSHHLGRPECPYEARWQEGMFHRFQQKWVDFLLGRGFVSSVVVVVVLYLDGGSQSIVYVSVRPRERHRVLLGFHILRFESPRFPHQVRQFFPGVAGLKMTSIQSNFMVL